MGMAGRFITGAVGSITDRFRSAVGPPAETDTGRSRALERGAAVLYELVPLAIEDSGRTIDDFGVSELASRVVRSYVAVGDPHDPRLWASLRTAVAKRVSGWLMDVRRARRVAKRNAPAFLAHHLPSLEWQADPASQLELADLERAIETAMLKLPEKRRRIYLAILEETATYAVIAARLGVTEKTVRNNVYRARVQLQAALREFDDRIYRDALEGRGGRS